jgi:oxygen-independent coproporphyrinogen-3 oxidase
VLKSLLQAAGLDRRHFQSTFGSDVLDDLPVVTELMDAALATSDASHVTLTARGLELSDAVGPWLWSTAVRQRMQEYEWR